MHYPTVKNRTYCLLEKQCDETSIIHGEQADVTKGNWTKQVERNIRMESEKHQQYKAPHQYLSVQGVKLFCMQVQSFH